MLLNIQESELEVVDENLEKAADEMYLADLSYFTKPSLLKASKVLERLRWTARRYKSAFFINKWRGEDFFKLMFEVDYDVKRKGPVKDAGN